MVRIFFSQQTYFRIISKIGLLTVFLCYILMNKSCSYLDKDLKIGQFELLDSFDIQRERIGELTMSCFKTEQGADSLIMIFNSAKKSLLLHNPDNPEQNVKLNNDGLKSLLMDRVMGIFHDGKNVYLLDDASIFVLSSLFDSLNEQIFFEKGYAENYLNVFSKFRVVRQSVFLTGLLKLNLTDSIDNIVYHNSKLITELRIDEDTIRVKRQLPVGFPENHKKDFYPSFYPIYEVLDSSGESYVYTFPHWDSIVIVEKNFRTVLPIPDEYAFKPKPLKNSGFSDLTEYLIRTGGNSNFVRNGDSLMIMQVEKAKNSVDGNGELITYVSAKKRMLVLDLKSKTISKKSYQLPPNCNPYLSLVFKDRLILFSETDDFKTRMYAVNFN